MRFRTRHQHCRFQVRDLSPCVARRVAPLGCRQASWRSLVTQRDFAVAKRPTPSKRNSPRGSRTSDPSWGVACGFCRAQMDITILNVEEVRDVQSSLRVWPRDFFKETGRPAQCLKPEMFYVRSEGLDMCVTEVVAPNELLITFDAVVLDVGDTSYVWGGEQCSQLDVNLAAFCAKLRQS